MSGLLSKERIIAKPGFNRWLVPPASIAMRGAFLTLLLYAYLVWLHLLQMIGHLAMLYGFLL